MFTSLNEYFASPAAKKQASKDYHCACFMHVIAFSLTILLYLFFGMNARSSGMH
jgi:hypothetical protein